MPDPIETGASASDTGAVCPPDSPVEAPMTGAGAPGRVPSQKKRFEDRLRAVMSGFRFEALVRGSDPSPLPPISPTLKFPGLREIPAAQAKNGTVEAQQRDAEGASAAGDASDAAATRRLTPAQEATATRPLTPAQEATATRRLGPVDPDRGATSKREVTGRFQRGELGDSQVPIEEVLRAHSEMAAHYRRRTLLTAGLMTITAAISVVTLVVAWFVVGSEDAQSSSKQRPVSLMPPSFQASNDDTALHRAPDTDSSAVSPVSPTVSLSGGGPADPAGVDGLRLPGNEQQPQRAPAAPAPSTAIPTTSVSAPSRPAVAMASPARPVAVQPAHARPVTVRRTRSRLVQSAHTRPVVTAHRAAPKRRRTPDVPTPAKRRATDHNGSEFDRGVERILDNLP